MKKGQSSTEFVLLATFMLFIFAGLFVVIQKQTIKIQEQKTEQQVLEVRNIIKTEFQTAEGVLDRYTREFFIPDRINGHPYTIQLYDKLELEIIYMNKNNYLFLPQEVEGNFRKGHNQLTKINDKLYLNCEGEEWAIYNDPEICENVETEENSGEACQTWFENFNCHLCCEYWSDGENDNQECLDLCNSQS